MSHNGDRFLLELNGLMETAKGHALETAAGAALILQRMVVDGGNGLPGTPEDTGQAKSNWFLEADGSRGRVTAQTGKQNMAESQHMVAELIATGKMPKYFSLYNNLPYIRHLEYGLYPNPPKNPSGKTEGGYSTQAPQGFFRLAITRWQDAVAQAAKERKA